MRNESSLRIPSWKHRRRTAAAVRGFKRGTLFGHLLAHRQVLLLIEEDLTVDERRFGARVHAERITAPHDNVGILADLDRADPILHAELYSAVVGDRFEGFVFGETAIAHHLRSVDVETARAFVGIG